MKSNTKSLTEGPLAKQILLVSLPLALSNLLQVLFNMSDVAVVGRFAGSTALGAVGSTSIFVTLFTGFLIGLSNGINVLVARFYGARHTDDVRRTVHSALVVSLIAGVVLLFVGLLGSPALLRLLNTKEDLLPGAILYLRVYFLGMPALALYNFGNAIFSAIGDTKKPLYFLSIAGVLNILLNLFFVIVCKLDVMGVALASAISQCVSAGLILHALTQVQDCYTLHFREARLDPAMTRSILALGLPAGFQNAVFAIANLFIQAGVNSFDSLMVKGNSAAANADNLIYDCMAAFYMACASFMSQNYGAGKVDRVKKSNGNDRAVHLFQRVQLNLVGVDSECQIKAAAGSLGGSCPCSGIVLRFRNTRHIRDLSAACDFFTNQCHNLPRIPCGRVIDVGVVAVFP